MVTVFPFCFSNQELERRPLGKTDIHEVISCEESTERK